MIRAKRRSVFDHRKATSAAWQRRIATRLENMDSESPRYANPVAGDAVESSPFQAASGNVPRPRTAKRSSKLPSREKKSAGAAGVKSVAAEESPALPETTSRAKQRKKRRAQNVPTKISLCGFDLAEAEGICGAANAVAGRVKVDTVGEMLDTAVSHVVMAPEQSTQKVLPLRAYLAAARGLWVLDPAWVYHSLEEGGWQDEAQFELKQPSSLRRKRLEALAGAAAPLAGAVVYLSGQLPFSEKKMAALCVEAGGRVVASHRSCNMLVVDDISSLPHVFRGSSGVVAPIGVRVVSSSWLFDTILPRDAVASDEHGAAPGAGAAEDATNAVDSVGGAGGAGTEEEDDNDDDDDDDGQGSCASSEY